jgi:hypothetical protein
MNELSRRADIALSNLTANGGLLLPEQSATFLRLVLDQPSILPEMRVVPMGAPEARINKIQFGSRILKPANQTGGAQDTGANTRYLAAADRSAPTTSQIILRTKEIMAEVRIPYEVLEDNIEKGGFENTVLALIAERAALDLEELVIKGDTSLTATDPYLGLMDGVLKLSSTNVVNAANAVATPSLWNNVKKALPTRYRRNLNLMRYYTSMDVESDYRLAVSARVTQVGDAMLTSTAPLPVFGIPMKGVALLPNANALLTNPQNLIFGIQRQIRIEQDRDIRSREVIIVLTLRIALEIEDHAALVKVTNIGAAA